MALSRALIEAMNEFEAATDKVSVGDYGGALPLLDRALDRFAEEGLRIGYMPALVLQTKGDALMNLGRHDEATMVLSRSMSALAAGGNDPDPRMLQARILNSTGMCLRIGGEYRRARLAYEEAEREVGEDPSELLVSILTNQGALASHHRDSKSALDFYERALDVAGEIGEDTRCGVQALVNLAGALRDSGQRPVAFGHLQRAREICGRLMNPREEVEVLISLAESYREVESLDEARECAAAALEIAERIAPTSELHARCVFAVAKLVTDDPEELEAGLERAHSLVDEGAPDSLHSLPIREAQAAALVGLGRHDEAIEVAEGAVRVAEDLRARSDSGLPRTQITSVTSSAYDLLAYSLIVRGKFEDCARLVEVLEHRRARWLLDSALPLTEGQPALGFDEVLAAIRPEQTVIYTFASIWTCATVTLSKNRIDVQPIGIDLKDLSDDVESLASATSSGGPIDEQRLERMSTALLGKIPQRASTLIVVPDGPIHGLPWAILRDPHHETPLGIARAIVHAASMSSQVALAERGTSNDSEKWLLVGAPDYSDPYERLPGAIEEIAAISSLTQGASVLTREMAVKDRVLQGIADHGRLHFACHTVGDSESGQESGLVLGAAPDGSAGSENEVLRAREIVKTPHSASTVVLSGCATGKGTTLAGEGLVGLVHAFQVAGSRQVLASHWNVGDADTALFMGPLYERLLAGERLEEAVLDLRRLLHDTREPNEWAAWSVHGPSAADDEGDASPRT